MFKLSPKFKAFLRYDNASMEFLEGQTAAGKTTVGVVKFLLKCARSEKKLHVLACKTTGIAEKNIINKDLGIKDTFGKQVEYNGAGTSSEKIPHIILHAPDGDKVIYILGYGDKTKWEMALGGQYGCVYIDEVNTANIDFVREIAMRCDYMMCTLNPDNLTLPIYKEYINKARPLKEWESSTPSEILAELIEPHQSGWVHWFFTMDDNAAMDEEKKEKIIAGVPKGTKLYKNKILGLRGKATGLVFSNFSRQKHTLHKTATSDFICLTSFDNKLNLNVTPRNIATFSSGLDTSYSSKSEDTIAMSFIAILKTGECIVLEERTYNNRDLDKKVAPSDIAIKYVRFLDDCCRQYGLCRNVFIDCADQATITELAKYKRAHPECIYIFNNSYKKVTILDRIQLQGGWLETGKFFINDTCKEYIGELERYSWQETKDAPEDGNDHLVNSVQYAWIPYRDKIGV